MSMTTTPPLPSPSPTAAPSGFSRAYRDAPLLWVLGSRIRVLVDSAATSGRYATVEVYVPPFTDGPPPHVHDDCEEMFHILEGGLKVLADGEWRIVRAGDTMIAPQGSLHTYTNPFLTACRFLTQITPGGFEKFFAEIGVAVERSSDPKAKHIDPIRPPDCAPPSMERLKTLAIKYRMRVPGMTDA